MHRCFLYIFLLMTLLTVSPAFAHDHPSYNTSYLVGLSHLLNSEIHILGCLILGIIVGVCNYLFGQKNFICFSVFCFFAMASHFHFNIFFEVGQTFSLGFISLGLFSVFCAASIANIFIKTVRVSALAFVGRLKF